MQAHIHASTRTDDGTPSGRIDTCYSVGPCEVKLSPLPWQLAGRTWTATGYGERIPTRYLVRFNGKWRRVYCRIYSNCGTLYIGRLSPVGERFIVQIDEGQ